MGERETLQASLAAKRRGKHDAIHARRSIFGDHHIDAVVQIMNEEIKQIGQVILYPPQLAANVKGESWQLPADPFVGKRVPFQIGLGQIQHQFVKIHNQNAFWF